MNRERLILAKRREHLVREAAEQRVMLSQSVNALRTPLIFVDRGLAVMRFIKIHPILIAGGSAILVKLLKKSFLGKWFGRGILAWRLLREL